MHGSRVEFRGDSSRGLRITKLARGRTQSMASDISGVADAVTPHMPLRVLVVDDNRNAADMTTILLWALGHVAESAHDALAAIRIAKDLQPDFVLLDLGIPGTDGFAIAGLLRDLHIERMRIIALTGRDEVSFASTPGAEHFDALLTKPASMERLRAVVK